MGKVFIDKDLFGKWVMLYFGFTYCFDICFDEFEKVVEVTTFINLMFEKKYDGMVVCLVLVFILIDLL